MPKSIKMIINHVVNVEVKEFTTDAIKDTEIEGFINGVGIVFSINKKTKKPVYLVWDDGKKIIITNDNIDKYKECINIFNTMNRSDILDIYKYGKIIKK